MTIEETGRIVATMLAAVPSHRMDAKSVRDMIAAYADLLSDLTYEQCNAALRVLLQTRTWLPSVADIRLAVVDMQRGPVKAGADAWGNVLKAISSKGSYRRPGVDFTFADPVVARCVESMGWSNLCLSENATSDRARFIELYDKLAAEGVRRAQSPALAAVRDQHELVSTSETAALFGRLARQLEGSK
jgi:hypothetical protein